MTPRVFWSWTARFEKFRLGWVSVFRCAFGFGGRWEDGFASVECRGLKAERGLSWRLLLTLGKVP